MSILALDPGNSTGWCFRPDETKNDLWGGTIGECHKELWTLLEQLNPDIVIYETFQMYPNKASKLLWNTFYPCEVIGVIKLWHQLNPSKKSAMYVNGLEIMQTPRSLIGLQPSVKKFALDISEQDLWKTVHLKNGDNATEHLRDAVRLLRYYECHKTTK